jgi:hypothetical protein
MHFSILQLLVMLERCLAFGRWQMLDLAGPLCANVT